MTYLVRAANAFNYSDRPDIKKFCACCLLCIKKRLGDLRISDFSRRTI